MLKHIFESSSALQAAEFIWVPCLGESGYSLCSSFRGGNLLICSEETEAEVEINSFATQLTSSAEPSFGLFSNRNERE